MPPTSNGKRKAPAPPQPAKQAKVKASLPIDRFNQALDAEVKAQNAVGTMLIRGVPGEERDDKYITDSDLAHTRMVVVTKRREKLIDAAEDQLLGDQKDELIMWFNTSYSYNVEELFVATFKKVTKAADASEKFDRLFAFTWAIWTYDNWMHDNEGGFAPLIKKLGKQWKELLANPDDVLKIDSKFTRGGVVAMLEDFKDEIEEQMDEDITFKF